MITEKDERCLIRRTKGDEEFNDIVQCFSWYRTQSLEVFQALKSLDPDTQIAEN